MEMNVKRFKSSEIHPSLPPAPCLGLYRNAIISSKWTETVNSMLTPSRWTALPKGEFRLFTLDMQRMIDPTVKGVEILFIFHQGRSWRFQDFREIS